MLKIRKGFTLLELVVILVAIGILSTLGYKKYSDVMEDSKAASFQDYLIKAEAAYAKVIASQGKIRPSSIDDSGSYSSPESTRCFDFSIDDPVQYGSFTSAPSGDSMDQYATPFANSLYDELINVGYKRKITGGLYIPGSPRSQFYVCTKHGARFFALTNVKGSIAFKLTKNVNNGLKPSVYDGKAIDRRGAIWNKNDDGVYDHMAEGSATPDAIDPTAPPVADVMGQPLTDEVKIALAAATTVTYAITQGNSSSSSW